MLFEDLATELILQVFFACGSIDDVHALSSTCKRFRRIFKSPQTLNILREAAETQYGPLHDAIQLVTHNASQPVHLTRDVPFSLSLLKQLVHAGRVAEKWCDIYPFKKWKDNFECRRLLTAAERRCLRRALYRLWLYSCAFHNRAYSRMMRLGPGYMQARARLLHNWTTAELAEMADVHAVMRDVVHSNICPSNATIARRFRKRFPEPDTRPHLLFNYHLDYPPAFALEQTLGALQYYQTHFTCPTSVIATSKYMPSAWHEPGAEGWGDDIQHYYVVEDMLKLDPEQIIWLKENAPLKSQVEAYVKQFGCDWFEDNGHTWGQTLEWVLIERGEDLGEFIASVNGEEAGVATMTD